MYALVSGIPPGAQVAVDGHAQRGSFLGQDSSSDNSLMQLQQAEH